MVFMCVYRANNIQAIRQGSSEVRIGSTIFGERPAKQDFKVKEEVEGEKS